MIIARNKRLAERFLVLLQCGLLQRRRFFYQNVQPTSGSGFLEIHQIGALYVTIEVELLKPFLIKLHYINEVAFTLSRFCTAIFIVATSAVHVRQNAVISK